MKVRTIQDSLHLVRMIVEKVNGNAALINLDKSKAFDRVYYGFLESVLSAAGFGLYFRTWIRLLYASPSRDEWGKLGLSLCCIFAPGSVFFMRPPVEMNGVSSEAFTLTRSIRQGFPLSPMLCILALEPFLRKLKANPALRDLMLPCSSKVASYTAYTDDVSVLVTSSAEVEEVSKEI